MSRYVVQKAEGVEGDPIPADEPCLVVRGQDKLALETLEFYRTRYRQEEGFSDEVEARLVAERDDLVAWQAANPDRVKLAD